MARITEPKYKQALRARYLDLREELRLRASTNDVIDDSPELREMRLIISIARLNGVDVDDIRKET